MLGGEAPADGTEVVKELFFVAGADDEGRDCRAGEEPVEGDLGDGLAGFFGDFIEGIDDGVEVFLRHLGATGDGFLVLEAAVFGERLATSDFAGETSPAERAPDDGADVLVEGEGHKLPFVVASDERVVGLVGDIAGEVELLGVGQGLHQVPAGEVRAADVANFAFADELVEGVEGFFDRGHGVEGVELEEVDVVGLEAFEGAFNGIDEVIAARTDLVGAVAKGEGGFGADKALVAASTEGVAEDFFGSSAGVDVGGVEHCEAVFEADVNKTGGFLDVGGAKAFEEVADSAEGARSEGEDGHFEPRCAEKPIIHGLIMLAEVGWTS